MMRTWFRVVRPNARWHRLGSLNDRSVCGSVWLNTFGRSAPRERIDTDEVPVPTCKQCGRAA